MFSSTQQESNILITSCVKLYTGDAYFFCWQQNFAKRQSQYVYSFNNDKRRKVYVYFLKMSVIVNDDLFIKQKCVLNNAFK